MVSDDRPDQYHNDHNRRFYLLGVCWLLYGIARIIAAVWLVFFSPTATVMFGALLNRVSDPFTMMNWFHVIYTVVVAWSAVCGAVGILAGGAILAGQRSARTLALIAAFMSLSEIPFGITLGVYTLVVLLPLRAAYPSSVLLPDRAAKLTGHASATS